MAFRVLNEFPKVIGGHSAIAHGARVLPSPADYEALADSIELGNILFASKMSLDAAVKAGEVVDAALAALKGQ